MELIYDLQMVETPTVGYGLFRYKIAKADMQRKQFGAHFQYRPDLSQRAAKHNGPAPGLSTRLFLRLVRSGRHDVPFDLPGVEILVQEFETEPPSMTVRVRKWRRRPFKSLRRVDQLAPS